MFRKILYGMAAAVMLVSCSEDFTDWANPQANGAENPKTASLQVSGVDSIDLAAVTADSVQVFSATLTKEEAATATYEVVFSNEDGSQSTDKVSADGQGRVAVADLTAAVQSLYGKRPTYRTLSTLVNAYVTDAGQALLRQGTVSVSAKPVAPVIEEAYYLIGTQNNWDIKTVSSYKFNHSASDVYDDPVFTINVKAPVDATTGKRVDFWFNIVPQSSLSITDKDAFMASLLGSDVANGDDRQQAGLTAKVNGGDNAYVQYATDGAKMYSIQLNLLDGTMKITPLAYEEWIYMPGNPQGWNPATAPALHSAASDGVYTGYAYLDGEFKFTKAASWSEGEYNWNSFTTYGEGFTEGGGGNISHGTAGYYHITANVAAGSLTATPVAFSLIGDALPGGWDADADMTYDKSSDCWTATVDLTAGKELKFRVNHDWGLSLGGSFDELQDNGSNIKAPATGTYTIKLYASRSNGNKKMYASVTAASKSKRHSHRK